MASDSTSDKKRVLIISTVFPPLNTAGTARTGKLAKYLQLFGWEPFILTLDKIKGVQPTFPLEIEESRVTRTRYLDLPGLLRERLVGNKDAYLDKVSSNAPGLGLKAYRLLQSIWRWLPLSILRILISALGWYIYAVPKGAQIIANNKIDLIFSSGPSYQPYFVASRLHQKTKIPWVADFRDLWTMSPYAPRLPHPWEIKLEKMVMRSSSLLVTVSQPLADILCVTHSKKVIVIPNGFDEDDYTEGVPLTSKFTLTYTGTIFPEDELAPLFQAISQLKQEGKVSPDDSEFRFFSNKVNIPDLTRAYGLEGIVKIYDYVPFRESIKKQQESSALLLFCSMRGAYSSKVFEYLGAHRPVIAVGRKGDVVDELLTKSGSGTVVNKTDEIKDLLARWIDEFRNSNRITYHYQPDENIIRQYTRREQAKTLAQAFDEVLQEDR